MGWQVELWFRDAPTPTGSWCCHANTAACAQPAQGTAGCYRVCAFAHRSVSGPSSGWLVWTFDCRMDDSVPLNFQLTCPSPPLSLVSKRIASHTLWGSFSPLNELHHTTIANSPCFFRKTTEREVGRNGNNATNKPRHSWQSRTHPSPAQRVRSCAAWHCVQSPSEALTARHRLPFLSLDSPKVTF